MVAAASALDNRLTICQAGQVLNKWTVTYSDRDGKVCRYLIEAPNGVEAKRAVYRRLGVKRLVGVNVQPA